MKKLKKIITLFFIGILLASCNSLPVTKTENLKEEPVTIANDSLGFEIIVIDIGFNSYLRNIAQPKDYYSQEYLEARNNAWVISWNQRVQDPTNYNPSIYENTIDYQPNVDYGYDVNYTLFNYFLFAQRKYRMNLGGGFRKDRIR